MKLRFVPVLALTIGMLVSAWLVLGPPDFVRSAAFFDGGTPTLDEGEAVMAFVGWSVICVVAAGTVLSIGRSVWQSRFARYPSARASLFLVAGLLLLSVSAINRSLPSASICCGSGHRAIQEAIQLAH